MAIEEEVLLRFSGESRDYDREINKVTNRTATLGKALGTALKAGAVALGALTAAAGASLVAFRKQEAAEAKVRAAIVATGRESEITADKVFKMASNLQKVSTFGDEAILEAQAILLTFKQLGTEVLPQATERVLDMAALMGTDLRSASVQLGKALNAPTSQLGALSRVGILFTEQQKEQIKTFEESGDVASAQKIILEELRTEFGGISRALADGTGVFTQLKNASGDLVEEFGRNLAPEAVAITERVLEIVNALSQNTDRILEVKATTIATVAAIIEVFDDLGERFSRLATGFGELFLAITDPFGTQFGENAIARVKTAAADFEAALTGGLTGIGDRAAEAYNSAFEKTFERNDAFEELAENAARLRAAGQQQTEELVEQKSEEKTLFQKLEEEKQAALTKATEDGVAARLDLTRFESINNEIFKAEQNNKVLNLEKDLREQQRISKLDENELLREIELQHQIELEKIRNDIRKGDLKKEKDFFGQFGSLNLEQQQRLVAQNETFGESMIAVDKALGVARSELVSETSSAILEGMAAFGKDNTEMVKAIKIADLVITGLSGGHNALVTSIETYGPIAGTFLGGALATAIAAKTIFAISQINSTKAKGLQFGQAGTGPAIGDILPAAISPGEIVVPESFSAGIRRGALTLGGPQERDQQRRDPPRRMPKIEIELKGDASRVLRKRENEDSALGIRGVIF